KQCVMPHGVAGFGVIIDKLNRRSIWPNEITRREIKVAPRAGGERGVPGFLESPPIQDEIRMHVIDAHHLSPENARRSHLNLRANRRGPTGRHAYRADRPCSCNRERAELRVTSPCPLTSRRIVKAVPAKHVVSLEVGPKALGPLLGIVLKLPVVGKLA